MNARRAHLARTAAAVTILLLALFAAYFILVYDPAPRPASVPAAGTRAPAEEIRVVTWNLFNFGRSKDEREVAFIADVLRDADLVTIQEVTTGPEGAQAVARLADALDRRGAAWDYVLSEPTTGDGSERYAYLWKPSRVRLVGRPWLEQVLEAPVDREPFMARFRTAADRTVLLASFHAVPTAKRPADEVALLDTLDARYPDDHLLIMGDFNLAESHYAFDELKAAGFAPVLVDQRTSLRMRRRDGSHLASEYDNIFYETRPLRADTAGVIDFTTQFTTLKQARTISDHLPVFMDVRWNGAAEMQRQTP